MPLADYALDKFVAPKLSLLTNCGAPELSESSDWLNNFILNSIFVVPYPVDTRRTCIVAFLRRAEAAFLTYRKAQEQLIQYVTPRPTKVVSRYFEAVLYFEICLAQWSQGADILRAALDINYFEKGDQSKEQRIKQLYNETKHLDEARAKGRIADARATIWITNDGLEGRCGAALSFGELHQALLEMGTLADKVSRLGMGT
jgi:hypothetical protein